MKAILVIRGVTIKEYENIRQDLIRQFLERETPPPFFCYLPGDYTDIDVVWLDEEMEKEKFGEVLRTREEFALAEVPEIENTRSMA